MFDLLCVCVCVCVCVGSSNLLLVTCLCLTQHVNSSASCSFHSFILKAVLLERVVALLVLNSVSDLLNVRQHNPGPDRHRLTLI